MILKKLKDDAEFSLGEEVTHAVITVPAYFSDKQRQATWEAGLKAGLNVMNILDEPTASAIAYGLDEKGNEGEKAKVIVVYDLGGGTFDVSVLVMSTGTFVPLNLQGDMWLGGDNFDKMIVDYVVEKIKTEYHVDPTNNIKFMAGLKVEAQKAKETLSSASTVDIIIPGIVKDEFGDPIPFEIEITRKQFEEMVEPLVDKTIDLVKLALKNANLTIENIDHVLMAGNASSVPLVQEKVEKLFGKEKILRNIHSKQCVARGAALIAAVGLVNCPSCHHQNNLDSKKCKKCGASLQEAKEKKICHFCTTENEKTSNVCVKCGNSLIDITRVAPFNYGIQTAGDKFSVFINKGDTFPTPEDRIIPQTFYTRIPGQRIISIPVYGGDILECASQNQKQGIACAFLPPNCPENTAVIIKLWLKSEGFFELTAKFDDGNNLKPWILRGKGDQKVEETLVDVESKFNEKKSFMTPNEKKEIDKGIEEISEEIQKNDAQMALKKAEELQEKLEKSALPEDQYTPARNIIAFAKLIVNEYGWLIGNSAYKLNDLVGQLEYALNKNDSSQIKQKTDELTNELDSLLKTNLVGDLFLLRMKIFNQLEPGDPVLANRFKTELFAIEGELKQGRYDARDKLVNLSERLETAVKQLKPTGIKCPICGYENPAGIRYCEGKKKDGKPCGADHWILGSSMVSK